MYATSKTTLSYQHFPNTESNGCAQTSATQPERTVTESCAEECVDPCAEDALPGI